MDDTLDALVQQGAETYVRFLVAAENAVLRGQFNLAKVLRALAYSQRTVAMAAARNQTQDELPDDLLSTHLVQIETLQSQNAYREMSSENQHAIEQWLDMAKRAEKSLQQYADVPEWTVDLRVYTCIRCGSIFEKARPQSCDTCGALSTEMVFFGPYYGASDEHLGQLMPESILEILKQTPQQVERLLADADDTLLTAKPSEQEWSIKEIIGHFVETDNEFLRRTEALLQGRSYASSMPPWELHEGKGYESMSKEELCTILRSSHERVLDYISTFTAQDWAKSGTLVGETRSVLDTGTWLANHDLGHLAQIERMVAN